MTTFLEPEKLIPLVPDRVADGFESAIAAYDLTFRCEWYMGCENEVEWFARQHDCQRAHVCDAHLIKYCRNVKWELQEHGWVRCRVCKLKFTEFDDFIKVVRI